MLIIIADIKFHELLSIFMDTLVAALCIIKLILIRLIYVIYVKLFLFNISK